MESVFFVCVAQDRLIVLQWMAPYSGIHGQCKLELVGFFSADMNLGLFWVGGRIDLGGVRQRN